MLETVKLRGTNDFNRNFYKNKQATFKEQFIISLKQSFLNYAFLCPSLLIVAKMFYA